MKLDHILQNICFLFFSLWFFGPWSLFDVLLGSIMRNFSDCCLRSKVWKLQIGSIPCMNEGTSLEQSVRSGFWRPCSSLSLLGDRKEPCLNKSDDLCIWLMTTPLYSIHQMWSGLPSSFFLLICIELATSGCFSSFSFLWFWHFQTSRKREPVEKEVLNRQKLKPVTGLGCGSSRSC